MKHKKYVKNLEARQAFWRAQSKAYQTACKCPGSLKK